MAEPQTNVAQTQQAPAPLKDWRDAWGRGVAAADAKEGTSSETTADAEAGGEGTAEETESAETAEAEGDDAETAETAEAAEADAAAADDKDKAKAKPEGNEEIRQLHELAKKHGFVIDGARVSTEERTGFRAERRKFHEKQSATEREFNAKVQQTWTHLKPFAEAKQLAEAGDYDGALRTMFKKDLTEINKLQADKLRNRDPRVDQIERENRELRERVAAREELEQKQAAEAKQRAEQERHRRELAASFTQGTNATHKKLATLGPQFVELVYAKQEEHWDGYETISAEDAATLVEKDLRADFDFLRSVFGDRDASTPESSRASTSDGRSIENSAKQDGNGKKPSKTLPKRRAAEASPPGTRQLTEQEWVRESARRMRQSSED